MQQACHGCVTRMKLHLMNLKHLPLAFVSCFALSCSMVDDPLVYSMDTNERTAGVPMAQARGVNVQVMDKHLESLMTETSVIEAQVQHLMGRLQSLRDEIGAQNAYKATIIETIPVAKTEPAKTEPQVILPASQTKAVKTISKPTVKKAIKKSTPKGKGVYKVRHGVHADKTRLVFDVNGSTKHDMMVDTEAGIVTITLPDTSWGTGKSRMYKLNQLSGYEAKSSGQGTIIAMAIANTSDVRTMTLSKPNRLVIDLMD